ELRKYNEAIETIDKALAIDPKNAHALDSKGFALDGLGRHNEAIALFNKALAIDPKNVDVLKDKIIALAHLNQARTAKH
ncbi:MAG: tetratricopeptide repeat protein, partial [Candidatus Nitrosopolaris sp.]